MADHSLPAPGDATQAQVADYLSTVAHLIARLPVAEVAALIDMLDQARCAGRTILICGNGGSSATASHWATDLTKNTAGPGRPRLRALALADSTSLVTAVANDSHYERVFAEQVLTWAEPGDVVIGISGSGNSPNVLHAMDCARQMGAQTVGLIGSGGGRLRERVDLAVLIDSANMEQIEDTHLVLSHAVTAALRARAALPGAALIPVTMLAGRRLLIGVLLGADGHNGAGGGDP
jgi:D-sedoheptulose 7-phosphate isomerase